MDSKPETCSICFGDIEVQKTPDGVVYWKDGNDAYPVTNGRCCNTCNDLIVIPARLFKMRAA